MAEYLINPLVLYLTVWCGATFLYLAGLHAGVFPRSASQVVWTVLLNVGTFALGYLTSSVFSRLSWRQNPLEAPQGVALTRERLRWSLRIALACGVIAFLFCAARIVIIAGVHKISLFEFIADPDLCRRKLVAYVGTGVNQTRWTTIAISVTSSLFSLGFVLLGILLYLGRRWSRYLYLVCFLILSLTIGILNLSRKGFVVNLLFLTLSYVFIHRLCRLKKTSEVWRHLCIPFAAVIVLFVAIDVLLGKSQMYGPRDRLAGFLFSIYWYIAAPMAAFGEFLTRQEDVYLMGQSLFLPLYKWLSRFGLAPPASIALYSDKVYIPYMVNVYSYLKNIHEDFGILGVAVVPYLLGWISSAMRRKANLFLPYLNIYLILLVLIIFSFYNYLFSSNQFYLQAFFGMAFFRFRLTGLERIDM